MPASSLEVHFINVSQGDSILIINRNITALRACIEQAGMGMGLPQDSVDWLPYAMNRGVDLEGSVTAALLIDGGDDMYGWDVFTYIQSYGVKGAATRNNFSTLVTHFHVDHVGGVRSIYNRKEDVLVDGVMQKQVVNNYPARYAYDCGDDPILNRKISNTAALYISEVNAIVAAGGDAPTTRQTLAPNDIINLGVDANNVQIQLRCIAANGVVSQGAGAAMVDIINRAQTIDENDRTLVTVLEYGDFKLILGGDSGGDGGPAGGNFGINADNRILDHHSSHGDLETPLRTALTANYPADPQRANTSTGHMCCFKADHHGSASSNDVYLLQTMLPKLVCCSSGTKDRFHAHPTQEAINRMDTAYSAQWPSPTSGGAAVSNNSIASYYITEMAVDGRYVWGGKSEQRAFQRTFPNGKILGDIILRPVGAVTPANPIGANTITVQVYGTGTQAAIGADFKVLRPIDPTRNGAAYYPVGPWQHICDKH